jgi:plastocyanin
MMMTTSSAMAETTMMAESSMMEESTMMMESSSTMMMESSSTMMMESSSTMMADSTSMAESTMMTSMAYGSGSSNWGGSGYNDCVQQCIASFGNPMATYSPSTASAYSSAGDSSGTGVTHTVIVAPTQGVLRYVPFATNASVGDTIKFMWNANMHTVTKSSQLELCNKTSDSPFTSGVQNQSFVFTQTVNTTDPTFFYCGVPTHCQKGMFGIINPPNAAVGSGTSMGEMMPAISANDSNVAAWSAYTANMTSGNAKAAAWGASMDVSGMPNWAQSAMAENVMYMRTFLAANPDVQKEDGSVDLGASGAPLMVPQDLNVALAASGSASSAGPAATSAAGSGGASGSGSAAGAQGSASSTSGARSLAASSALAGAVAFGAAFFAL